MNLEERIAYLSERAKEKLHGPIEQEFASIVCDGCGRTMTASPETLPKMLRGWQVGPFGLGSDFCPGCVG